MGTDPSAFQNAMKTENTMYRSPLGVVLAAAALLLVPLLAMQLTDAVVWGPLDFAVAGTLLVGTGLAYQAAARKAGNVAYRFAVGIALGAALFLVWANLAVGVIGDEGNPANAMYIGVLAVGIVGAIVARLRPGGMARALFATAIAQAMVAIIAIAFGLGGLDSGPREILAVNGLFVALFAGSALLFRRAAHPAD
jgi:hypothetical protein